MTIKNILGPAHAQPTRGPARRGRRYPSDLADSEWAVIAPLLPAPHEGGPGRPVVHSRRVIVDAILYVDRTGCAWRYLPADFPPWRTVYGYFARWRDEGIVRRVHDQLRALARAAAGRNAEPSAAVIDSQSIRAADTVPKASRGWDNAKKVNGRKRHIAVDTTGLLLTVLVTAASVQDRDAAKVLLWNLRKACHCIIAAWANAGYAGKLTSWAQNRLHLGVVIVRRREAHTFHVLPWVVEHTFAWISEHRRTVRDYERLPSSHEAMVLWAMIALMTARLAQQEAATTTD